MAKEQFQLPGALAAAENLICAFKQRSRGLPLFLQPFVLDIVREQCSAAAAAAAESEGVNDLDAASEENDVNGGTGRVL